MASKKLDDQEKAKLRGELKAMWERGDRLPDIIRHASKKYGISSTAVRHHLDQIGICPKR